MKKILFSVFVAVLLILCSALGSAAIFVSGIDPVYNLGDEMNLEIKILNAQDLNGFIKVMLDCEKQEQLIYFSPVMLKKDEEKAVKVDFPVTRALGACMIHAALEDNNQQVIEKVETSLFSLTDEIKVNLSIENEKESYLPSEQIKLKGRAVKANGELVSSGIAKVLFQGEESFPILKGKFSFSLNLSPEAAPGKYEIKVFAEDEKGNKGAEILKIEVAQVPTSLEIETNSEQFMPGELLLITPKLLDQANGTITEKVKLSLTFVKKGFVDKLIILLEEEVLSGNQIPYKFGQQAEPGTYTIKAESAGFEKEKTVTVQELELLDFKLENSTLFVTNLGNVPYKKSIEISFSIENQTITKSLDLDLKVGETEAFLLQAPDGMYDIQVKAKNYTSNFSSVPLTGSVVAAVQLRKKESRWIWLIVILIAALLVIVLRKKKMKKKLLKAVKEGKVPQKAESKIIEEKERIEGWSLLKEVFSRHRTELAASALIPSLVYGTKQALTVLALNFPGFEQLKPEQQEELITSVVKEIKNHQGVADVHGSKLVAFFNIIKQYRHDVAALRTAQAIRDLSKKYGVAVKAGIHQGIAIVSSVLPDKSLKYTALDQCVALSKKLADKAKDNEILFSETIYKSIANLMKASKTTPYYISQNQAIDCYKLEDASPAELREKYKWYVGRALG